MNEIAELNMETELRHFFEPLLKNIYQNISLVNWPEEKIRTKYAKQSVNEILKEKEIFYMQPCLPLTMILKNELSKQNITSSIIIDELYNNMYKDHGLHFALEFNFFNNLYSLNFSKLQLVEIMPGPYFNSRNCVETIQKVTISDVLDLDKNIFENFPEKINELKYFDFEKQLERLICHNKNPLVYENYIKTLNENNTFNLYFNFERKKEA